MLTLDDFDTPWHSPYAKYICGGPGAAAVAPILASSPKCGTASSLRGHLRLGELRVQVATAAW